jgi:hypothetical protein
VSPIPFESPPNLEKLEVSEEERLLLHSMRQKNGARFPLFTSQLIRPTENVYYLQFGQKKLYFKELDHGMKYGPFLGTHFVPDLTLVDSCPSATETFRHTQITLNLFSFNKFLLRCSWLSLGAATGFHPFYLQSRFRQMSAEMLSTLTEDNDIWGFGSYFRYLNST